jgi:NET1-associated nuclear protein 1 (U3 small nucleolar RNA-associated protein 17)
MATVDAREGDSNFRAETYLKLWAWNEQNAAWILNTRIDKPHGKNKITSLAFSVGEVEDIPLQLATVGEDGTVRAWRLRNRKSKSRESEGQHP